MLCVGCFRWLHVVLTSLFLIVLNDAGFLSHFGGGVLLDREAIWSVADLILFQLSPLLEDIDVAQRRLQPGFRQGFASRSRSKEALQEMSCICKTEVFGLLSLCYPIQPKIWFILISPQATLPALNVDDRFMSSLFPVPKTERDVPLRAERSPRRTPPETGCTNSRLLRHRT